MFPKQKDIIYTDYEPHSIRGYGGYNQANICRLMVVFRNKAYNEKTGLIVGMSITIVPKNNPYLYELILLPNIFGSGIKGYIVLWQMQNFDYRTKNYEVVGKINDKLSKELRKTHNQIFEKV